METQRPASRHLGHLYVWAPLACLLVFGAAPQHGEWFAPAALVLTIIVLSKGLPHGKAALTAIIWILMMSVPASFFALRIAQDKHSVTAARAALPGQCEAAQHERLNEDKSERCRVILDDVLWEL